MSGLDSEKVWSGVPLVLVMWTNIARPVYSHLHYMRRRGGRGGISIMGIILMVGMGTTIITMVYFPQLFSLLKFEAHHILLTELQASTFWLIIKTIYQEGRKRMGLTL